jgi:hypothetical protein
MLLSISTAFNAITAHAACTVMKAELTQKMKPSTSRPMGPQMSCPTLCGELAANGGQRGKGRQDVTRNDSLGDSVDLGVSDFERSHDVSRPLDEARCVLHSRIRPRCDLHCAHRLDHDV